MRAGYKESELGFIPNEWTVQKLENCVSIKSGDSPVKFNLKNTGKYPYIKVEDLNNSSKYQYLSRQYSDDNKCLVNERSIVFPKRGAAILNNKIRISLVPIQMDSNLMALLPKEKIINTEYLYYKLIHEKLYKIADTSTIPQINNKHINPYKIALPSLKEQKAIADCLSSWDRAIELQRELILSKEARKKSLAQQLLTGKRRLPGFTNEWKEEPYGKLLSQVKRKENWEDNHLYHLISVRRRSGGIFHRDSLYGHQIAVKELMKVKKGDFLISKMQILHGASSIVKKEFENFYVSGSYIILNVRDLKKLSPDYLGFYSKQKIFYHQTYISSYGVHIEKMTFDFKTFLKMNMMFPSIEEQNAIVKVLETADKELQLEKQKLANLQQQKKALMQQLLTGKVRLV